MRFDKLVLGYEEKSVFDEINKSKEVYNRAKKDREYASTIERFAFENYVNTIKSAPSFHYDYIDIKKAINFLKYDKSNNKAKSADKDIFDVLENYINTDFFSLAEKSVHIVEILIQGFEEYGYQIRVKLDDSDDEFFINIPVRKHLTTENIDYANQGMFAFGAISENVQEYFLTNYDENELAKGIKEYFLTDELNTLFAIDEK